eukprot:scaffold83676_cov34-Phaeocystis_antarctica.AAC.2
MPRFRHVLILFGEGPAEGEPGSGGQQGADVTLDDELHARLVARTLSLEVEVHLGQQHGEHGSALAHHERAAALLVELAHELFHDVCRVDGEDVDHLVAARHARLGAHRGHV